MKAMKTILIITIGLVVLLSCDNSNNQQSVLEIQNEAGFVGTVDETGAFIAMLIANDEAIVYVCNGDEEIAEWFRGSIDDTEDFKLTNIAGAMVQAEFSGKSFSGVITLRNGLSRSFKASSNTGTLTGVFRVHGEVATEAGVEAGWILNSQGDERGAFKISGRFSSTPQMPKFINITDGTSNTIAFGEKRFRFDRFFIERRGPTSSIVSPNN